MNTKAPRELGSLVQAEKAPYKPPSKANEVFDPALDEEQANRDARGRLVFEGQDIFRPTLTPRQVCCWLWRF